MEIQQYIDQKKTLQNHLLTYLREDIDTDKNLETLTSFIKKEKINENSDDLKEFIRLIVSVSKNYHHTNDFFNKFDQILQFISSDIKKYFSEQDIFILFRKSIRLLLYIFENGIITITDDISKYLTKNCNSQYRQYFYNEIKDNIKLQVSQKIEKEMSESDPSNIDEFNEKRKIGENDSYLTKLIRNDSIEEFVSYTTKNIISLSSTIKWSIFDTNKFLRGKNPTLIEYSAFFGSIQIFQYLQLNGIELNSSLWLYAIHGNNPQIIHILEENKVKVDDGKFESLLNEAIKCYHNDIANYIRLNLMNINDEDEKIQNNFNNNFYVSVFKHYNYELFPENFENKFFICYLCQNGYFRLVKLLVENKIVNINKEIILNNNKIIFNEITKSKFE